MKLEIGQIVSLEQANKDFGAVSKIADEHGAAIIADDAPKYLLFSLSEDESERLRSGLTDEASKRIFQKYRRAFEELAK